MSASDSANSRASRRWLWAALTGGAVLLLCIIRFGMDAGSTWDEPSRAEYGDLIIRWFTSGFHDTRAVHFENLFPEGGLFEVFTQSVARLSPAGVIETRHLLIGLVGLLGIVVTGLTASEVASPRAGFLAAATLTLTPAWMGHAWFNSKDIPFGTAAIVVTWLATKIARRGAPLRIADAIATGLAFGAALAIRPGGYFLAIYPICAAMMAVGVSSNRRDVHSWAQAVRATAVWVGAVTAVAWPLMLVAWPWAWSAPVVRPLVAMKFASNVSFSVDTLFRGQLVPASAAPRSYLPIWFAITIPDFYFVAFALGVIPLATRRRLPEQIKASDLAIISLAIVLPIGAAIITRPAIYDGLRHFLFVFPPLAALAGIAVSSFIAAAPVPRIARGLGVGILFVAVGMTIVDVMLLHPYEYAYFNRFFGGLRAAQGRFETDYWGAAYKEGFEWVVSESHASSEQPLRVASCTESSNKRLEYYRREWPDARGRTMVVPPQANPDVFLESTRRYLCTHVDGPVIHTISRLGVPLLYVRQISPKP